MKIVLANGCFDPFHWGHLQHLKAARKLGDLLYVSVTADGCVNKGPGRPVFNHHQRADVIRALEMVHGVIVVNSSMEALMAVAPDVFVKGREYEGKIRVEDEAYCKAHGIEIVFTDEPVYSSTKILDELKQGRKL